MADLAAGDTSIPKPENILIKRKKGGNVIFRRPLPKNFVKDLGAKYLADEVDDQELEIQLRKNTTAFLRAKAKKKKEIN